MELKLTRKVFTDKSTIGELSIDGKFECYILEDKYRQPNEPKVYGETAIPCGTFPVTLAPSPRLSKLAGHEVITPRLHNIPGYEGVLIHPGNYPKDTEGCLLPGKTKGVDCVGMSVIAYEAILAKLKAAKGPITIKVELA